VVGHCEEFRGAERLGVHVRCVELAEDFSGFDLAQYDLFLNVVQDHQEVFTLLGISRVVVGHCDNGAIILHYDCGKVEGDRSSWQRAIRKLSSLAKVNIARASAWVEEVATAVCLTLRL